MKKTFDDIIRRRWESRSFEVDDQHRQDMIQLLEDKQKRRAIPFWWWGGGIGVMALAIGLFLLSTGGGAPTNSKPALTPDAQTKSIPHGDDFADANAQHSHPITTENQQQEIAAVQNTQSEPDNATVAKKNQKETPHEAAQPATTGTAKGKEVTKASTQKESVTTSTTADEKHVQIHAVLPQADEHTLSDVNTEQTTRQKDTKLATVPAGKDEISAEEKANTTIQPSSANPSVAQEASIADAIWVTETLDALDFDLLFINSTKQIEPVNTIAKRHMILYPFAEGGVGLILASKPSYDAGAKFHIGGGLGLQIRPGIHASLSGGYAMQQGGFSFERNSAVHHPGFGVRSEFNTLRPDRLHYVYSQLNLQARKARHIFNVGGGVQRLYGAQGEITTQTINQLSSVNEVTTKRAWLNTSGLALWQVHAQVSYGYAITARLQAKAGTQYYFTDLIKQDPVLSADGYYWSGKTAAFQPFFTLNYLLYGIF